MSKKNLVSAVEALLFAAGDSVPLSRMAASLEVSADACQKAVHELQKRLEDTHSGLAVIELEDSFQMVSKEEYAPAIRNLFELRRNTPLSQAAFEVLSVIAYNQPVTKAYVEQVRGVDCSGVISSLSAKGLIEECGRLDLPGRPLLYSTTQNFLRCFSLSSLEELPPIPEPEKEEAFAAGRDAQKE
ncbi:MAG: SMC-Scp complex subunit ScpB, partial [Clostridia bacterium]|nr:SMC-Scp complex subunit ScpB [Clostridia bacterium]